MERTLHPFLSRGREWTSHYLLTERQRPLGPGDPAYTFLDNRSRVALVVLFFGARGPRPHLLGTTHMEDGHASCHTHTWGGAGEMHRFQSWHSPRSPPKTERENKTHPQAIP